MTPKPFISVIIPTFRCWSDTLECLQALSRQTYPSNLFEIIVVNNDPDDPPPSSLGGAKLLQEPNPGSYSARNKGISQATGELLAFTDADCVPEPNWLSEAVNLIKSSNMPRIGGKIVLTFSRSELSPTDAYQKVFSFNQKENSSKGRSVTANMVVKREIFESIGNFNSKLFSGGDFEWSERAALAGFHIIFGENVIVRHPVRATWGELIKKSRRTQSSLKKNNGRLYLFVKSIFCIFRGVLPPVKSAYKILKSSELTTKEKMLAWCVCYGLKIHGHAVKALAGLGIIIATRS